ncbi:hypothetical protein RJ640_021686 [Escallonia rubra]|uniref:Uncharacterized protein n=1 Tax=Escallonia rubra TaxID=112253 RepID=A0AA88QVT1_9ASTE|nr:hypothetical protein RJ640_021686 [Escallonia rubra]
MEGGSKKRKFQFHHEHACEEEEAAAADFNDEEKMEKFFAIIRSIRDARNSCFMSGSADKLSYSPTNKKLKEITENQKPRGFAVRNPSFQREDFEEEDVHQLNKLPRDPTAVVTLVASSQQTKEEAQEHHAKQAVPAMYNVGQLIGLYNIMANL